MKEIKEMKNVERKEKEESAINERKMKKGVCMVGAEEEEILSSIHERKEYISKGKEIDWLRERFDNER